jgi:LuxR family maltose regulon positive regulatory protein
LTLRFHNDPGRFVAEFGGTDRFIAEYLTEEVLDALPAEGRELLLRMSPLDVVNAELLDHVLDRCDGGALIERLEQESMFLLAVDERREWFRFHHLFRDLLRYRLRTENAVEEGRILVRAAEFHLDRGEQAPAIEYLLRARKWGRALDAIMTPGAQVLERSEARSVIRWITAVPEAERAGRLDVALELGILPEMQGDASRATDILSRVATDPAATVGERAVANVWISATAQWNTRPTDAIRAADRGLAMLTAHPDARVPDLLRLTTSEMLSTHAIACRGRAQFLAGDHDAADSCLAQALTTQGISYPPFRVETLGSLALLRAWNGRLREAEALVAEALDTASASDLLAHPVVADTYLADAMIAHERGRPEAAIAPLENGTLSAEANHRTQLEWIARYEWALLAGADHRFDEALRLIDPSRYDDTSAPAPVIHGRLVALHMSVLRRMGRSKEALSLRGTERSSAPDITFESAAAWLTLGDRDQARRVIDESPPAPHAEGPRADIRRLEADAWLAEVDDDHRTALDLVDMALDRADPEQLVDVFISTDAAILDLVAELATSRGGVAEAIVERRRRLTHTNVNPGLLEPLTERELEILAYLPDHATGPELARLCSISINTLKTHLAHIYRKLGVSARTEAIGTARELGLLSAVIPAGLARA